MKYELAGKIDPGEPGPGITKLINIDAIRVRPPSAARQVFGHSETGHSRSMVVVLHVPGSVGVVGDGRGASVCGLVQEPRFQCQDEDVVVPKEVVPGRGAVHVHYRVAPVDGLIGHRFAAQGDHRVCEAVGPSGSHADRRAQQTGEHTPRTRHLVPGLHNVQNVDEADVFSGANQMDLYLAEMAIFRHHVDDCLTVDIQRSAREAGLGGELDVIDFEGVEFEFQDTTSPSQCMFGARGPATRWNLWSAVQSSQSRVTARAR